MGKRQGKARGPKATAGITIQEKKRTASDQVSPNILKTENQSLQAFRTFWCKCKGPFAVLWAVMGGPATVYGAWTMFDAVWPAPSFFPGCPSTDDPFNIPFRVENTSPWLDIYDLKIECLFRPVQFTDENGNVRYFDRTGVGRKSASTLEARGHGHYTCPVEETIGAFPHLFFMHSGFHVDFAVIEFSGTYSVLGGLIEVSADPSVFSLNTKTMPRQWMQGLPIY